VILAGVLTFQLGSRAAMARSDRLVLMALVVAAYAALLLGAQAVVVAARRLAGERAASLARLPWAYVLLALLLVANHCLTAFGHKDVTYRSASWPMRQGPWLQALLLGSACIVCGAALLALLRARWWSRVGPSFLGVGALIATLVALLPPGPGAPLGGKSEARDRLVPRERAPAPLLLVGIDGLDPKLLNAALTQGRLRQLKGLAATRFSLLDNGGLGHTPPVWTTITTGKPRAEHRIYDFVTRRSPLFSRPWDGWWEKLPPGFGLKSALSSLERVGLMQTRLVDGRDRRGPSVWQILSRFGVRSLILNYPISYPAERVNGVFVSSNAYHAALVGLDSPSRLPALGGHAYPDGFFASSLGSVHPERARPNDVLDVARKEFDYLSLLAEHALGSEGPFDFVTFYTPVIDPFNHRLSLQEYQAMLDGRFDGPLAGRLLGTLEAIDSLLERLRALMPSGTRLLLVSDHGVTTGFRKGRVILQHRLDCPGVLLASGQPADRTGLSERTSMYDLAPTILAYFGVPPAADMPGRVLGWLVEPGGDAPPSLASYDSWVQNSRTPAAGSELGAVRERLKALGYVE
jgi:hypothetical protein